MKRYTKPTISVCDYSMYKPLCDIGIHPSGESVTDQWTRGKQDGDKKGVGGKLWDDLN